MRLFRAYYARISDGADHSDAVPAFIRTRFMAGVAPTPQDMAAQFATPLASALNAASRISDRFSPDGMMALRDLVGQMQALDRRSIPLRDLSSEISSLLRQISGFAGLVHENMYRSDGWRFLSLGISLERAENMCTVLAACSAPDAPMGAPDLALEIGDSVVSHRAQFGVGAGAASVVDLLALDGRNPRSVRYHISRTKDHIAHLPRQNTGHALSDVARRVLLLETALATRTGETLGAQNLDQIKQDIWGVSNALNAHYLV